MYWKDWLRDLARWSATAVGRGLLIALVLLYLVKGWRRLAPSFAKQGSLARLAYRAELDRLAEVGITRRRGESREAFAERVQSELPSFSALTALHVGARFGSLRAQQSTPSELKQLATLVQTERVRAFGWLRRLAGALSPWSFFKAR
jgi:hypothetical protein